MPSQADVDRARAVPPRCPKCRSTLLATDEERDVKRCVKCGYGAHYVELHRNRIAEMAAILRSS